MNSNHSAVHKLGQLFAPLRDEQVLIMASGSITHNLRQVRVNSHDIEPQASDFKYWMIEQLQQYTLATNEPFLDWQRHSLTRHNHPTAEHLLPLFFAYGAGDKMTVVHESFANYSLGMDIYRFD